MLIAVDVDYRVDRVVTAAVGFTAWTDSEPAFETVRTSHGTAAAYTPGAFYVRELPHLMAILEPLFIAHTVSTLVIDGYVTLDGGKPGLGSHLRAAIASGPIVVGVAKRPWRGGTAGVAVTRGKSAAPLYVTATGMSEAEAAQAVMSMHGEHRIPTLLKRVDRAGRDA